MSRSKLKVLIHSNHSRLVTGFGKNIKTLLLALHEDPDIEVVEAANGVNYGADLMTPWESYGTGVSDPNMINSIKGDHMKERYASYGGYMIDKIIEDCKPDVYLGIEDIWAFTEYHKKPWWNKINKVLWTTLDSVPILDQALDMAPKCDEFLVWASFAEKEMHRLGQKGVKTLHGAVDYTHFKPLENRDELRNQHGLSDSFVIGFVFKNQLRKSVPNLLDGFKIFKKNNPDIKNPRLLLHTDWGESGGHGWDIPRYLKEKEIHQDDVLATYVCHRCDYYCVAPYQGEDKNCPVCKSEKSFKTKTSAKGVGEKELNEIYNCMDVYCHPFTSGGQELPIQEAKAAGLITLVTEYSCGTDSCYDHQGGIPLQWHEYREPSTQFVKASTCAKDIASKLTMVSQMTEAEKYNLATKGIKYVKERFSVENTVRELKDILLKLKKPEQEKEQVNTAEQPQPMSLESLLDDEKQEDRIAVVMPESAGDVLIINSLMGNLKKLYPEKRIYVFTKQEYFHMIDDNPAVHKVLPFQNGIDNLLLLEGRAEHKGFFEIAFLPNIGTQKYLNYLHNGKDKTQFKLR